MKITIDAPDTISTSQKHSLSLFLLTLFGTRASSSLSGHAKKTGCPYTIKDDVIVIDDDVELPHSDFEQIVNAYRSFK